MGKIGQKLGKNWVKNGQKKLGKIIAPKLGKLHQNGANWAKLGKIAPKTVQIGQNWVKLHKNYIKNAKNYTKIYKNMIKNV